jgi:DNA helicase-2/ATP-dependent DNA helicase PcrA
MRVQKVFGPPGSGKTTYLLGLVEKELEEGTSSSAIGYFSFTRKASIEARERAIQRFPTLVPDIDFPWFRTLHSLAYYCLGVSTKDMMRPENFREFSAQVGIEIVTETDDEVFSVRADNPILNQINLARIKGEDLRVHYNRSNIDIEWHHFEYISRAYRHYKASKELLDFNDLLERILEQPERLPSLDVLIIDEAQDLSKLQWQIVEHLVKKAKRSYLAGDDDQAVYNWAGADVHAFLGFEGEPLVLQQSYRVPLEIHALANRVVKRIRVRQEKIWHPREERGTIAFYNDFQKVDLSSGQWLVLAATNHLLNEMHTWLKGQGILFERHGQRSISEAVLTAVMGWETLRRGGSVSSKTVKAIYKYLGTPFVARGQRSLALLPEEGLFSLNRLRENYGLQTDAIWHEALTKIDAAKRDYIIAILRRKTKLTGEINVKLSTIHGAKGGEADNVLMLTELSTKFADEYQRNPDDINRLLYVGITRAKQSLHLVHPRNAKKAFFL